MREDPKTRNEHPLVRRYDYRQRRRKRCHYALCLFEAESWLSGRISCPVLCPDFDYRVKAAGTHRKGRKMVWFRDFDVELSGDDIRTTKAKALDAFQDR